MIFIYNVYRAFLMMLKVSGFIILSWLCVIAPAHFSLQFETGWSFIFYFLTIPVYYACLKKWVDL